MLGNIIWEKEEAHIDTSLLSNDKLTLVDLSADIQLARVIRRFLADARNDKLS